MVDLINRGAVLEALANMRPVDSDGSDYWSGYDNAILDAMQIIYDGDLPEASDEP